MQYMALLYHIWYNRSVQKTTVYLDESDLAKLRALAQRENVKPAMLIRKAVSALVDVEMPPLPRGTGKYRSGNPDGSSNRKAILRSAVRRGRW